MGRFVLSGNLISGLNCSVDLILECLHDGSDQVKPLLWGSSLSLGDLRGEGVGRHEGLVTDQVVIPVFTSSVLLVEADDLVFIASLVEAKLDVLVHSGGVEVSKEVTSG